MVRIPSMAPVGIWRLAVDTWQDGPTRYSHQRTFRTEEQFYVLFNPYVESKLYSSALRASLYSVLYDRTRMLAVFLIETKLLSSPQFQK